MLARYQRRTLSYQQRNVRMLLWSIIPVKIKQVFEVRKATAGKEKEGSWQLAVERRSKFVLL